MDKLNLNELKFVAYLRKSTDREDKQIQSLDTQLTEVKRIAEAQNFEIVEFISESKSAKKQSSRDGFNTMVKAVQDGKFNAIVSISPDRLSRNAVDAGILAELLTEGELKFVVTTGANYDSNPMSVLMFQFLMMNAKLDNMVKADKVRGGLASKIEKGWFPSVAPQGYLNTKLPEKGNNTIIKDVKRFNQVRRLWDMVLTGSYTINELVDIANTKWKYRSVQRNRIGGTPISRSGLYDIFSNPFYYGFFKYKGELHKGAHTPMITKKEFDLVQEILGRKNKRRPKTHVHTFTGLIKCPVCGCSITATHKEKNYPKTGNHGIYDYYHCSRRNKNIKCKQPSITENKLEEQLIAILSSIEIPEDFRDWAKIYLVEKSKYEAKSSMQILDSQQKEYKAIEEQLTELLDMRMNKEVTPQEYAKRKSTLEETRNALKGALGDSEKTRDQFKKDIEEVFDFACSARRMMENGELAQKREVLAKLGQNLLLKDGKLCIDLQKPFLIFKKSKKPDYVENKRLEPVDLVAITAKYGVSEPADVSWLPSPSDNINAFDIEKVLVTMEDTAYIGMMKERWEEIKRLNKAPAIT